MKIKKILLVAKPWKGGLGHYIYLALKGFFSEQVVWISTRPQTLSDQIVYRRDRNEWNELLLERVKSANFDAALFINRLDVFENLPPHENMILWLTDGPRPKEGELSPFARVFVTDAGYSHDVLGVVGPERFGGEVSFGYSPDVHCPDAVPRKFKKTLCFIGNRDVKRDKYLEVLFHKGLRPTIVGNYFFHHPLFWRYPQCFRPPVSNRTMGKIYAAHKVSVNIHADVVRQGTNMRTFECAAYGIPQIIEYRPGLERFFLPGDEVVVFSSPEEMLEQANRLLRDSDLANKLATAARQRALAQHTYFHRIAELFQDILPSSTVRANLLKAVSCINDRH